MSFALIHLGLGENDQAIQWLERAYEVQALLLTTIVFDERFDPLRADARFSDLVRRLGLSERSSEAALAPRRMVP
jgi:serine/threonine-protein kinase